jgi:hypothetical protein
LSIEKILAKRNIGFANRENSSLAKNIYNFFQKFFFNKK